ncbi:MAG: hypothetical protein IKC52_05510 [Clostridia bacterium]|nr:hypothetical protein [Clostridia bacterium]
MAKQAWKTQNRNALQCCGKPTQTHWKQQKATIRHSAKQATFVAKCSTQIAEKLLYNTGKKY